MIGLSRLSAELATMPDALERLVAPLSAAELRFRPASWEGSPGETFSALEHACHVRDIESDGYQLRIRRLLEEDNPSLVSLDGYALASQRRYSDQDAASVLAAFREARRGTIAMLQGLSEGQLARTGTFADYGPLTLRALLHYLRSHDQQHLACLQWLAGRMASAR